MAKTTPGAASPTPQSASSPSRDDLRHRQVEFETPEQVAVGYELAGPGSRFVAFVLDALIITTALILLAVLTLVVLVDVALRVGIEAGMPWVIAISSVVVFALVWGYFIAFEGLRNGQTPGKRWMGLRVVYRNGFPLTLPGSAIRNLLRIVDLQPGITGLVGGLFILFHPRAQRPGDLAAGTVVIRERTTESLPAEADVREAPVLDEDAYAVLRSWALQRGSLAAKARARITDRLARQLATHLELAPQAIEAARGGPAAEEALLALYQAESGRRATSGQASGAGSPAAASLLRRQRPRWEAWDRLLADARKRGLPRLEEDDLTEFASLYREVTADLARARTYRGSQPLLAFLEDAVGRGHNLLYRPPTRSVGKAWHWLRSGVPRTVRRCWAPILLATALFYGPGLVTFAATAGNEERIERVTPATLLERARAAEGQRAQGIGYGEAVIAEDEQPLAAASILTNNVRVTFMAFAGGLLAGLGTVAILVLNGVMLGAAGSAFHFEGQSLHLWAFVAPHGVLELTAICLAGGAALWMASAILMPGRRSRADALMERTREAISIMGGVVIILVIAGIIEGFVSPSPHLSEGAKIAFGIGTGLVLFPWLLLAGADEDEDPDQDPPEE
ncbi:MAG: hypothetical protein EA352_01945 [Gemmatimonadales bacterium]|nr:MAG: hypothetical protein EA352_01945 [Gemmatimonadales bacterium]